MAEDIRPEAAVRAAKQWLTEIYAEEAIVGVTLEEVRFRDGNWEITLGFNRRVPDAPDIPVFKEFERRTRTYKVLVVAGNDYSVMEMRDREVA